MAPTVIDYGTAFNQLGSTYDPQVANLNDQSKSVDSNLTNDLNTVDQTTQNQLSSLDQAKVNAFRDINTEANRKGMLFSGFSPDQEATYLGTKYLPARANAITAANANKYKLTSTANQNKMTLSEKIAQLNGQRQNDANKMASDSVKAYNDYQKQQDTNAYRQAQLGLGYARLGVSQSRAAAAAAKSPTPTVQNVTSALRSQLSSGKLIGGDGHVAPATLAAMYNTWMDYGLGDKQFWTQFQGLWNNNQGNYKQMFNAARNAR